MAGLNKQVGDALSAIDFNSVQYGAQGNGVISGLQVVENTNVDMNVIIQSGSGIANGTGFASNNQTVVVTTANTTYERIDTVSIASNGTATITAGTPAATPIPANIPANEIPLGTISVPASDTTVSNSQITDRRLVQTSKTVEGVNAETIIVNALNNRKSTLGGGYTITEEPNLSFSLWDSDDADFKQFMDYNAGNKAYDTADTSNAYWLEISGTGLPAASTFEINECKAGRISDDTIIVWCTDNSNLEVNKAKVICTTFWGDSAQSDPPGAKIDGFTTVTAIKTSDSSDVGKKAYYFYLKGYNPQDQNFETSWDLTFVDTTTNLNVNSWSFPQLAHAGGGGDGMGQGTWEMPDNTILNEYNGTWPGGGSNEFEVDTSADELDNPANAQVRIRRYNSVAGSNFNIRSAAIILCKSAITSTLSGNTGNLFASAEKDYFVDDGVPAMTASTLDGLTCFVGTPVKTLVSAASSGAGFSSTTISNGAITVSMRVTTDNGATWGDLTDQRVGASGGNGTKLSAAAKFVRTNTTDSASCEEAGGLGY